MMKTQLEWGNRHGREQTQPSCGVGPQLSYPTARGDPGRGVVSGTGHTLCQSIHRGMRAEPYHIFDGQQLC